MTKRACSPFLSISYSFQALLASWKTSQGARERETQGQAWELAVLIFNSHLYLKHLLLKQQRQLEAWAMKWCSASSREVSTWLLALCCVHPRGKFAGGNANAPHAGWHLLLLEKLMIKWLVGSYSLVYYIKALAKKRLLQYSQAESSWRGQHNQSTACLSRDSWRHNSMIVKTLEINSFLPTPEKIFGLLTTKVKLAWTLSRKITERSIISYGYTLPYYQGTHPMTLVGTWGHCYY